ALNQYTPEALSQFTSKETLPVQHETFISNQQDNIKTYSTEFTLDAQNSSSQYNDALEHMRRKTLALFLAGNYAKALEFYEENFQESTL
ncbi:4666_t:CDS:2, partial [Gigaspora margarita]